MCRGIGNGSVWWLVNVEIFWQLKHKGSDNDSWRRFEEKCLEGFGDFVTECLACVQGKCC